MQHDITYYAKQRQAVKAFDISKKIPADKIEKIKALLGFSASSVNAKPSKTRLSHAVMLTGI